MKTTKEQRAEWLRYGAGEDAAHEKIITELCDDLDEALADAERCERLVAAEAKLDAAERELKDYQESARNWCAWHGDQRDRADALEVELKSERISHESAHRTMGECLTAERASNDALRAKLDAAVEALRACVKDNACVFADADIGRPSSCAEYEARGVHDDLPCPFCIAQRALAAIEATGGKETKT